MKPADGAPGAELRKFLRAAERRRTWAAFLRAAPKCAAWLAAAALAVVLVIEAQGTRVGIGARVDVALAVVAAAGAYAFVAARGANARPLPRWLDARMGLDGLIETAAEMHGRPELLPGLCVRAAEERIARESASALVPLETPRVGLALGLLAVLVLTALLPPLGLFGRGSRGLGAGSGEATFGRATPESARGAASGPAKSARPRPGSRPAKEPEPSTASKLPSSKPSKEPPDRTPEEIPPFTPTPKFIPIDPRGALTSKRETLVVDLPEPETFGAAAAAAPRSVSLDAPRIEALRRAAERALASGALDPDERAFVTRYFEILAR